MLDVSVTVTDAASDRSGVRFRFTSRATGELLLDHLLPDRVQASYLDLFAAAAAVLGTRVPLGRRPSPPAAEAPLTPLLTEPVSPDILYGYGDPSVLHVESGPDAGWWLTVTSNDAPNAFPLLRSGDLVDWRPAGFVFPDGRTPAWALTGANRADFWAPEMHRIDSEVWVVFAAREHDRGLAVGLARADRPGGPFRADPRPLVAGGVIDAHIVLDRAGAPWLVWKKDDNERWPNLLCDRLHRGPELIGPLFPDETDRRTAALIVTLWPWARTLEPMERFCVQQPLIEAATADFAGFRERLHVLGDHGDILDALRTRILAQKLSPDGLSLTGEPRVIMENDQPWEAHLIEGVWITPNEGRWLLFHAANDFSTPDYGVGVAVADDPLGPYRKQPGPLLRSTAEWVGPGHPSVAPGPDGRPRLFLHAFRPGEVGYKAFRALLSAGFALEGDRVVLR